MKKLHIAQYWLGLATGGLLALAVVLGAAIRPAGISTAQAAVEGQAVVQGELASSPAIHYQGRLLVPGTGEAKPDGSYQMTFSIYNVATSGAPLWTETKSVAVSRGNFNTLLGDTTALTLGIFSGQDLYLGVTIGGDPEATPRQRLAHVAYAIHAENAATAATAGNADTLDGQDSSAFAVANHTHDGASIVDGSIGTADLADGAVTAGKLAPGVVPKFISLDPYAAFLNGATVNDGFGPNAGIDMVDAASNSFALGFTIPPDYVSGSPLTVRVVWHTPSTNCGIVLSPNFNSVARPGRTHIVGGSVTTGFTSVGGDLLVAPATANQSGQKRFTITSPVPAIPLLAGDSIIFGLYRSGTNASDTCTGLLQVQAVSILY